MNLYQIHYGLTNLIGGIENGMVVTSESLTKMKLTQKSLLKLTLYPMIDGYTTAEQLEELDVDDNWQDDALTMIKTADPNMTYGSLPDLIQGARRMRQAEKWLNTIHDRDGIKISDY